MQDRHIGDVRVTRIEEQMGPGFPAKDFFPEFDAETFAAEGHWLAPSYYQPESGRLMTSIHSWLLRTGKHTILVDACSGNHKPRPGMPRFDMLNTQYLDRLREAGVQPEEIDFVMCTHLHVDHVGWNTRLENGKWVPTFPNAKYVMSRTDHDLWEARGQEARDRGLHRQHLQRFAAAHRRGQESRVRVGRARHVRLPHAEAGTRPHAGPDPASISNSRGKRAIFAGDALHNPLQVPLWKWNSCFCEDRDLARKSRHTLLADCVEQGALLMPAHFAPPHAAYIKDEGDRFELDWDYDNERGR